MSSFNDCRFEHVFQSDCFLQGPAGTGKTESVKALGNQLGRFVLVFNCDENFDFQVSIINDMKYVIQNSNFRAPLHVHLYLLSTKLYFSARPWVVSLWGCVRWEPGAASMSSTGWRRECCPPSPSRSRPYRKPSKTWLAKRRRV